MLYKISKITKFFFLSIIVFLCLNFFSFQFQIGHNKFFDSNFRVVRSMGLKNFFSENQGKFFTINSLEQKTETSNLKQELDRLIDEEFVIKITSEDLGLSGADITFYGVLERRLIPEDVSSKIATLLKDNAMQRGSWFVELRNPYMFKRDLKAIFQARRLEFESIVGEENVTLFEEKIFPSFLEIYGDNLERLNGHLYRMFENLKYFKYEDLENYVNELIFQEMNSFIEMQLYNTKERNVAEKIKEIVAALDRSIPEFKSEFSKNGDTFVGFVILGSWAYMEPSPNADLDITIITDGPITTKSNSFLNDEIRYLSPVEVDEVQYLDCQCLDISNPNSFDIFDFPNSTILIRNFILLTDDSINFRRAVDLLIRYYHPHLFTY